MWLPLAVPLAIAVNWQFPRIPTPQQKLPLIISLYLLAPILLWGVSRLEDRPFSSYGLALTVRTGLFILLGLGISLIGLALVFSLETHYGWIVWQSDKKQALLDCLGPLLLLALLVSVVEELVFRGFLVNQLLQTHSPWVAAIGASLLFALLHGIWDGPSVAPQLPGLWLLGMVLVLARLTNEGNLGLAIGLHSGWVWGLASLDVSQMLHYPKHRPLWLTGLSGQPLAGVLGIVLLLATAGIIWGSSYFTSPI
ncbi:MAG TPA: type II CAAX endopeptidase family protein [Coleofasciculaceae cyanobacterium]